MAQIYENDKNFLIIEMSYEEACSPCNFGFEQENNKNFIVCDSCNNLINEENNIYYVAVLNRALCKECCDDFIKGCDKYPEDEDYEKRNFNYYAKKFNIPQV